MGIGSGVADAGKESLTAAVGRSEATFRISVVVVVAAAIVGGATAGLTLKGANFSSRSEWTKRPLESLILRTPSASNQTV